MQTDIRRSTTKRILDRFEDNADAKMDIKVNHFALNLKPFVLKSKITEFNEMLGSDDKEGEKKLKFKVGGHPFDDLDLAENLAKIVDKYDYAVEDYLAIRFMIDSQFEVTQRFVKTQAFIYITFFFIPMLLQIFCLNEYPDYVFYCINSCLITNVLFLGIEFIQLDQNGPIDYISDGANQVDLITLFTFFYYYILRFYDQADPLVSINDNASLEKHKEVNRIFWYAVLQTMIVGSSFLKLMSFLKVVPSFGLLVDSINQCIVDCIPFTTFLTAWMGVFMILYRIMGCGPNLDGSYGASDKTDLNLISMYAIQTYRNTVGDDAPPTYPYWDM